MEGGDCFSGYFLIAVLLVFFMLAYVYVGLGPLPSLSTTYGNDRESFYNSQNRLIDPNKLLVFQGNSLPDTTEGQVQFDQGDPAMSSVDGTEGAPKSMFVFAYNKCDVGCCGESPYSCNGGCVCMTDEQKKYLGARGKNNAHPVDEY